MLYLNEGLHPTDRPVDLTDVKDWCAATRRVRASILPALGEPFEVTSSSENVALAMPAMATPPESVAAMHALVAGYEQDVALAAAQLPTICSRFLASTAAAGRSSFRSSCPSKSE
jgi:hypothetical protein